MAIKEQEQGRGKIGFWISTSLSVGNMTGSGIFLLPAALAVYGGISILGWIYTVAGSLFLALMFSRLSRIVKKAGGPYAYAKEGFGNFPGFLVAWGYWISIWCGNAAIAVAGVGYLSVFIPALKDNRLMAAAMAIAAIWLFTFINTKSIRKVGITQLITTIIKILPLVILGSLGFFFFNKSHFVPFNLSAKPDFQAITSTAALTLWAFLGLESATIPSDKVKNPVRTIPRATIAGLLFTAVLYLSSTVAVMGIVSPADLAHSAAPFADAAGSAWGKWASVLVATGASIACFGALNGWILLQGQIPLAASRDNLFPSLFKITSGKGIPVTGLIIGSILASLLVGINFTKGLVGMFSFIIMLSTLSCLFPYLLSSLSEIAICLKDKKHINKHILASAVSVSIPAFLYSLWAITGLETKVIIWGIILLGTGIPVYFMLERNRNNHK
ncbi:MAG TPA: amino acid permease [Bacteroidales bacterium]|nr:amino acid permease [Bacteroidales bacterium]